MHIKTNARIFLSADARKALLLDVYKRCSIEACGVLIGSINDEGNWYVEGIYPLPNIAHSPSYFEFAPEDLLAVDLTYPGQIIGVYHSHPTGFAKPSQTDRQNMKRVNIDQQIPWVWLIVCGPFGTIPAASGQAEPLWQAEATILAFHHYAGEGLCSIPLQIAQEEE